MRKLLPLILVMLVPLTGFTQRNIDKLLVKRTLTGFFDALADLNVDKMATFCTPDVIILEDGQVWNLDTLTRLIIIKDGIKDFKRLNKLDFLDTEIHNRMAWTYYHNHASITANGKDFQIDWLESAVLIKKSKKWKIRLLHSTSLEDFRSN